MSEPTLMKINEVAAYLSVSRATVYRFIHRDGLPYVHVGPRRRVRREDLEAWIAGKGSETASTEGTQ